MSLGAALLPQQQHHTLIPASAGVGYGSSTVPIYCRHDVQQRVHPCLLMQRPACLSVVGGMHLQELSRVGLRQKQLREQECARINSMKIHNQWRKIMRVAKVEELRGEVEILSQNHEREVDRKDALVQVSSRSRPDRTGQQHHGPCTASIGSWKTT